ncbi:peptidoglycan-binding domain-containing protein [Zavarzinia sp. CC-PAN008]|uniref:peptidoglycan-binding domain-containing protein n=1 Tax=Zavarzinia sp. CC-PAN008 TaxID=3243332 RepID=UPI003F7430D8
MRTLPAKRLLVFLMLAAPPVPALAQGEVPACSAANQGAQMCQMGQVCTCRWRGGAMFRGPEGFAWDCSLLGGQCGPAVDAHGVPADLQPYADPYANGGLRPLSGPEIVIIQERLNAAGYPVGRPDGVVGERTRAAIRDFQADNGLEPDGVPSTALLERLP